MATHKFTQAVAVLAITLAPPALADEYVDTAQLLLKCAALNMHISETMAEHGDPKGAEFGEGLAKGGFIAAAQSLKNGGYKQDYIDDVLPGWMETARYSFDLRNREPGYLDKAMAECAPVINGPHGELVDQWRAENGK